MVTQKGKWKYNNKQLYGQQRGFAQCSIIEMRNIVDKHCICIYIHEIASHGWIKEKLLQKLFDNHSMLNRANSSIYFHVLHQKWFIREHANWNKIWGNKTRAAIDFESWYHITANLFNASSSLFSFKLTFTFSHLDK